VTIELREPRLVEQIKRLAADQAQPAEKVLETAVQAHLDKLEREAIHAETEAFWDMHDDLVKKHLLNQLHELDPTQWSEVLTFIGYLKHREALRREQPYRSEMTARDLLQSQLVGIWADREDIKDSLMFARQLRQRAERRQDYNDDIH
jgi:hypothetical protein